MFGINGVACSNIDDQRDDFNIEMLKCLKRYQRSGEFKTLQVVHCLAKLNCLIFTSGSVYLTLQFRAYIISNYTVESINLLYVTNTSCKSATNESPLNYL